MNLTYIYIYIYDIKMAAPRTRVQKVQRFLVDSNLSTVSSDLEERLHRKSAGTAPQKIDGDDKRCAGSRSKRNYGRKGGNVSQVMVREGIDDRIDEGCVEGIDERGGEVVGEVC